MAQAPAGDENEARTYSLTPEQFRQLMEGMTDLGSYTRLDARREIGGAYSTGVIVRADSEDERIRLGLSGRPEDAVATLRRYFDQSGAATRYTIRTTDPAIQARLAEMNVTGITDEQRLAPIMEATRRFLEQMRTSPGARRNQNENRIFEPNFTEGGMRALVDSIMSAMPPAYTLTPEQFRQLMRRDDMRGLVALDDLVAHVGANGSFSRVYIQPNGPIGTGAAGTADAYYNRFTGQPERYVLNTSDPRILNALRDMNIQPRTEAPRLEAGRYFERAAESLSRTQEGRH